ncbi:MAG: DUF5658 family protein [Candidatus Dormibacteraceae bacterium]
MSIRRLPDVSTGGLTFWIALLALVELADAVTTGSGMAHGDVEANRLVATLISWGGLPLLYLLKGLLVVMLGTAATAIRAFALRHPGRRSEAASMLVRRGTQLSVIVLGLVVLHNIYLLTPLAA